MVDLSGQLISQQAEQGKGNDAEIDKGDGKSAEYFRDAGQAYLLPHRPHQKHCGGESHARTQTVTEKEKNCILLLILEAISSGAKVAQLTP